MIDQDSIIVTDRIDYFNEYADIDVLIIDEADAVCQ